MTPSGSAGFQPPDCVEDEPGKLPPRADILIVPIADLYVHSFNKHLMSTYYVPGTSLGSGDTGMNKITPCGISMGVGEDKGRGGTCRMSSRRGGTMEINKAG